MTMMRRSGKIESMKAMVSEIDDQDIEEIDHHPEDGKLELRQQNHEPDQTKRQRSRNSRPPQQREEDEIERGPGQR